MKTSELSLTEYTDYRQHEAIDSGKHYSSVGNDLILLPADLALLKRHIIILTYCDNCFDTKKMIL
jgi:hypothetical protein